MENTCGDILAVLNPSDLSSRSGPIFSTPIWYWNRIKTLVPMPYRRISVHILRMCPPIYSVVNIRPVLTRYVYDRCICSLFPHILVSPCMTKCRGDKQRSAFLAAVDTARIAFMFAPLLNFGIMLCWYVFIHSTKTAYGSYHYIAYPLQHVLFQLLFLSICSSNYMSILSSLFW